jgi:streptogramin lyase
MQEEANGAIWIGLHNSGVQVWQNGVLTTLTAENGNLSHNAIRSLWLGREGEYWIGTNNGGLNRLRRGSVEMLDTASGLGMDKAFAVTQSRDGALWVATAGAGVYKFAGKTVEAITEKHGLGQNIVRSLYEDREGRMWFGTSGGGVQCFDVQRKRLLESLNERNGFCNNIVYSMYEDKAGGMWFATERGLAYRRTKGDSITTFSTATGLTYNRIRCFAEDSAGVVWVGTGYGLNGFVDGKLTMRYTEANGFAGNNRVFAMYADADTALWLGTFNSGLFRLKHGVFTQFTQANGLFDDVVYSIAEDAQGQLWMSCNRGIYKVSKQLLNALADSVQRGKAMGRITCEVFTKNDGLNDNECNGGSTPSVWVLHDGRLAFPTLGGVALLHPDRILRNTLPPKVIIEEVLADTVRLLPAINAGNDNDVVREVEYDKNNFEFRYTATSLLAAERVRFKFMLEGYDKNWILAEGRRVAYYTNLPSGNYRFRVQACNNDGVWNEQGAAYAFRIAVPWWSSWWAWGVYTVSVGSLGFVLLRYRDRRQRVKILTAQREREAEIVRRKNEELERANQELRMLNDEKNEFSGTRKSGTTNVKR